MNVSHETKTDLQSLADSFQKYRSSTGLRKVAYPESLRRSAVELVRSGRCEKEVSALLGIAKVTLKGWIKKLSTSSKAQELHDFIPLTSVSAEPEAMQEQNNSLNTSVARQMPESVEIEVTRVSLKVPASQLGLYLSTILGGEAVS